MKKGLAILLATAICFTTTDITAFAAEGERVYDDSEIAISEVLELTSDSEIVSLDKSEDETEEATEVVTEEENEAEAEITEEETEDIDEEDILSLSSLYKGDNYRKLAYYI